MLLDLHPPRQTCRLVGTLAVTLSLGFLLFLLLFVLPASCQNSPQIVAAVVNEGFLYSTPQAWGWPTQPFTSPTQDALSVTFKIKAIHSCLCNPSVIPPGGKKQGWVHPAYTPEEYRPRVRPRLPSSSSCNPLPCDSAFTDPPCFLTVSPDAWSYLGMTFPVQGQPGTGPGVWICSNSQGETGSLLCPEGDQFSVNDAVELLADVATFAAGLGGGKKGDHNSKNYDGTGEASVVRARASKPPAVSFSPGMPGCDVYFGNVKSEYEACVVYNNGTTTTWCLVVDAPPQPPGTYGMKLCFPNGYCYCGPGITGSSCLKVATDLCGLQFTYTNAIPPALPVCSTLSPGSGSQAGGNVVQVGGTFGTVFPYVPWINQVTVNGNPTLGWNYVFSGFTPNVDLIEITMPPSSVTGFVEITLCNVQPYDQFCCSMFYDYLPAASSLTAVSSTTLSSTAHAAAVGQSTAASSATSAGAATTSSCVGPLSTSISPGYGPDTGGTFVTLTGTCMLLADNFKACLTVSPFTCTGIVLGSFFCTVTYCTFTTVPFAHGLYNIIPCDGVTCPLGPYPAATQFQFYNTQGGSSSSLTGQSTANAAQVTSAISTTGASAAAATTNGGNCVNSICGVGQLSGAEMALYLLCTTNVGGLAPGISAYNFIPTPDDRGLCYQLWHDTNTGSLVQTDGTVGNQALLSEATVEFSISGGQTCYLQDNIQDRLGNNGIYSMVQVNVFSNGLILARNQTGPTSKGGW